MAISETKRKIIKKCQNDPIFFIENFFLPEMGLRKALGATGQDIGFQFLAEVVAVTLVSGLLGVGLGLGVASLVSMHMDIPVMVSMSSVSLGLGAAALVGIVSGIMPARKAASLDPVEALR